MCVSYEVARTCCAFSASVAPADVEQHRLLEERIFVTFVSFQHVENVEQPVLDPVNFVGFVSSQKVVDRTEHLAVLRFERGDARGQLGSRLAKVAEVAAFLLKGEVDGETIAEVFDLATQQDRETRGTNTARWRPRNQPQAVDHLTKPTMLSKHFGLIRGTLSFDPFGQHGVPPRVALACVSALPRGVHCACHGWHSLGTHTTVHLLATSATSVWGTHSLPRKMCATTTLRALCDGRQRVSEGRCVMATDAPIASGAARHPVLVGRSITKVYRMGDVDVHALRGVDVTLYSGELLVLLGASGSGKSTLLNILGGLDTPSKGEVFYRNQELTSARSYELTRYRREHVGFVFQFYNLIPSLTARENVALVTEISADPLEPGEALELVGLGERVDHFPAQLSGGEQQRVAIARAIAKQPEVLLCDEPTGALDYRTGIRVLEVLEHINRDLGTTTAVITHNAPIAAMADRVITLQDGRTAEVVENATKVEAKDIRW